MSDAKTYLIADDHPLFRSAMVQTVKLSYPNAGVLEAADVSELQAQLEKTGSIDLLLLDLHMPGALGFSALSWFVGQFRQVPVIIVSANTHPETVSRALNLGASAFLSKSADPAVIHDCIAAVLAGEKGLHPGVEASTGATDLQSLDVAEAVATLTPQQFRVASMLADGLLNKQIAFELEVKEATIKAHMTEIFRKLGVHSRTQAALLLGNLAVEPPADISSAPAS